MLSLLLIVVLVYIAIVAAYGLGVHDGVDHTIICRGCGRPVKAHIKAVGGNLVAPATCTVVARCEHCSIDQITTIDVGN